MVLFPLIVGAGSGAAMWLYSLASERIDATDKLDYSIKVASLKFKSATELELALDVTLINKANVSWNIKHPAISVFDGNTLMSESAARDKKYEIKANSTTKLDRMYFPIPILKLAKVASQLISPIISGWEVGKGIAYNIEKASTALMSKQAEILKTWSVKLDTEVNGIPVVYTETELVGLGYAPMSAIDRPIALAPADIDKLIPRPNGTKIVWQDKNVHDTVKLMVQIVEQDHDKIKEFSKLFKRSTVKETSKAIFDFVFKYIKYNIEDGEQLKNPLVTYDLGQRKAVAFYKTHGYWNKDFSADCDDMAIFVASILRNLGISYTFEVASYKDVFGQDKGYSHVYVNLPVKGGNIIIDPVYYAFNQRKDYSRKFNYSGTGHYVNLNGMDITYLGTTAEQTTDVELDNFLKSLKSAFTPSGATWNNQQLSKFDGEKINSVIDAAISSKGKYEKMKYLATLRQLIEGYSKFFSVNAKLRGYINGIEEEDKKIKQFLIKSRNDLARQGGNFNVIEMFDYAIKYWDNSETREKALEYISKAEQKLVKQNVGFFGALYTRCMMQRNPQYNGLDGLVWDNLKAFITKYKIPVAIGTGLTAGLITYVIYKGVSRKKTNSASSSLPAKRKNNANGK